MTDKTQRKKTYTKKNASPLLNFYNSYRQISEVQLQNDERGSAKGKTS